LSLIFSGSPCTLSDWNLQLNHISITATGSYFVGRDIVLLTTLGPSTRNMHSPRPGQIPLFAHQPPHCPYQVLCSWVHSTGHSELFGPSRGVLVVPGISRVGDGTEVGVLLDHSSAKLTVPELVAWCLDVLGFVSWQRCIRQFLGKFFLVFGG